MNLTFRPLEGNRSDMQQLQVLIDSCEEYYNQITGYPPGLGESGTLFSSLPDNKDYDDKFLYGLFDGDQLVACADVIRAYPLPETAEVGIVLVHGRKRRRGYGKYLIQDVEKVVTAWPGIKTLQTELPSFLPGALVFATSLGFIATGSKRAYRYQHVTGEQEIFEKNLKVEREPIPLRSDGVRSLRRLRPRNP